MTDRDFSFCHKLPYKDGVCPCSFVTNIALLGLVSFYFPAVSFDENNKELFIVEVTHFWKMRLRTIDQRLRQVRWETRRFVQALFTSNFGETTNA